MIGSITKVLGLIQSQGPSEVKGDRYLQLPNDDVVELECLSAETARNKTSLPWVNRRRTRFRFRTFYVQRLTVVLHVGVGMEIRL